MRKVKYDLAVDQLERAPAHDKGDKNASIRLVPRDGIGAVDKI